MLAANLPSRAPAPLVAALFCFLLSLAMHLPWLGCTPIAGTEGHRIFPAHEMVRSHNWLVPMMFGKPFMTKPPLHHWLIGISELLLTRNAHLPNDPTPRDMFAWRLPSALAGAALCAAACLFGARWFGRMAGLISGVSAVGMIAIWGQSQVADIDSTNTFAAALTAFCGIELYIASPARKWPWVALASVAMGATLMTKGPAGLTIILGVWAAALVIRPKRTWIWVAVFGLAGGALMWGLVLAVREKRARGRWMTWRWFWRWMTWRQFRLVWVFRLPIVLGAMIFFAWGWAAKTNLRHNGLAIDNRGIKEATHLLIPKTFKAFVVPLGVMLPQLIAFALPLSGSLLFLCSGAVRENIRPPARRVAMALAAAVLISWAIAVVSTFVNPLWAIPRYYYPTLLPLCPLAGAVAIAAAKSRRTADWLRAVASVAAIALCGAAVGLAAASWKMPHFHAVLVGCAFLAVIAAAWVVWQVRTSWNGAWGIVLLVLLVSVPFGAQRHYARTYKDSGIHSAAKLKRMIGERSIVAVGGLVTSKPETLTYANVRVAFYYPNDFVPKNVPAGVWVILDQAEHKLWRRTPGIRLEKEQLFCRNGKTDYYLAWYGGVAGN
jgi:4-amino-4-deoxy-L-arabinose transferase-like glycosyltransferase